MNRIACFSILASLCALTGPVSADNFQILHSFNGSVEGQEPNGGLVLSTPVAGSNIAGSTLFGTTAHGKDTGKGSGYGTIFSEFIGGGPINTLHAFAGDDGDRPNGYLALFGSTLYGAASSNDVFNRGGTIYSEFIGGGPVNTLKSFPAFVEAVSGVIRHGSNLYGTTGYSWLGRPGTIFKGDIGGGVFETLHTFSALDGEFPSGRLTQHADFNTGELGSILYGTTDGGFSGHGTVFKVGIDGSNFQTLHTFNGTDGSVPLGSLVQRGSFLYGTTIGGGTNDRGTVFKVDIGGNNFETLHSFTGGSDGQFPTEGLTISNMNRTSASGPFHSLGGVLYGTTNPFAEEENDPDVGTVFKIAIDGSGFQTLHRFTEATRSGGAYPNGGLAINGSMLYGTTIEGGAYDDGTVYAVGIVLAHDETTLPTGTNISRSYGTGTEYGPDADYGAGVTFPLVIEGGTFTGEFYNSVTNSMVEDLAGSDAAGTINFGLGPVPQLWALSFTGKFDNGAMVTFRYDPTGLSVAQESDIRIRHFKNGQWLTPAGQVVDTNAHTITVLVDSFSPFLLEVPVPEPSSFTLAVFGMGALCLAGAVRRRGRPRWTFMEWHTT